MKKFMDGGEYFTLSAYRIIKVPIIISAEELGINLAKTICEDACYLSADGSGQTAIEFLRVAGDHIGNEIRHLIAIRTHDRSEKECVLRQEALVQGLLSMLHQSGYVVEEIPYEKYHILLQHRDGTSAWALSKRDVQEYGIQGTYRSVPIVDCVDWRRIYSVLDGSGCSLCIQIIPAMFSDRERRLIVQNSTACSQATDGVVPNMRDSLAASAAERWKYYGDRISQPAAEVNIVVSGSESGAALTVARIRQAVKASSFEVFPVPEHGTVPTYNHPWRISLLAKRQGTPILTKWTSDEVTHIFRFPARQDYFIGAEGNPYSLVREDDLLCESMTLSGRESLRLGTSIHSIQKIFLPKGQFLLHTAVLGKSGTGKTTFLKWLIQQFHHLRTPVLIMEPVKREYRDMLAQYQDSKIFTVENPAMPLLINPFLVPEGVRLGEYRSSLLSAFKAAFSLPDPLPALFEKAISEAYIQYGWTDMSKSSDPEVQVFDMADFIRVFKRVIVRSAYSGEVKGNMMSGGAFRLQSLMERCPQTFDTSHSTDVEDLLTGYSVLEMGNLEPEQKSLVSALTLIRILAYLKATRKSGNELRNIILIDEAHALLDQGEGTTVEEKALNSTMTQLMINIITEIRAYGVGVIFADQSPSRVGSRMLDNVDNLISFRLSGEEAQMLSKHMGAGDDTSACLPLMAAGEFIVKNQFLRFPLAVQMQYIQPPCHTDEQIVDAQRRYVAAHAKDYRPFVQCEAVGCGQCTAAVRALAHKNAIQIFSEWQARMRSKEDVTECIMRLPEILSHRLKNSSDMNRICKCVAVHLLRQCSMELGISFSADAIAKLLQKLA